MPKHLLQDIVVKAKRAPATVAHEMEMRRKDVFVERVKQVKKEGKRQNNLWHHWAGGHSFRLGAGVSHH